MSTLIPDFDSKYAKEIRAVVVKIALQEAIVSWRIGDSRNARDILKPFCRESLPAMLISMWAWILPFRTFDFANRVRVGLKS